MPQTEQQAEQAEEQLTWETPELVKSDVATATQFTVGGPNFDGALGTS